jgi:hypothetical protein
MTAGWSSGPKEFYFLCSAFLIFSISAIPILNSIQIQLLIHLYKLFIALIKDTTYMTSITINGNGGLISKRDFYQPTHGCRRNKFSKHKSEQQTIILIHL